MTIEYRREAASAIARFLEVLLNEAVTQEPTIVIETSFEPNPGPLWPAAGEAPWSQLRAAVADMLGHGVAVSGLSWCDRLIVGASGLLTVHAGLRD